MLKLRTNKKDDPNRNIQLADGELQLESVEAPRYAISTCLTSKKTHIQLSAMARRVRGPSIRMLFSTHELRSLIEHLQERLAEMEEE